MRWIALKRRGRNPIPLGDALNAGDGEAMESLLGERENTQGETAEGQGFFYPGAV